jgi:hypothetical protein
MQATSTPQLAQPKLNALGAFLGAVTLAVGILAGTVIGVALAPDSSVAPVAGGISPDNGALRIQRSGEIGAMTAAERSLLEQRRGEINAGVPPFAGAAENNMSDAAAGALKGTQVNQFRGDRGYWRNHAQEKPSRFDTEGLHAPVSHGGGRAKAD